MVSVKESDFWIHPNALAFTLNYFEDQQLVNVSILAGAVIMAYKKDYIGFGAARNFREWTLQAYPTKLTHTSEYYVHARIPRERGDHTALIIYSRAKFDLEGRKLENDIVVDEATSDTYWYIYLGKISSSVDADGATVDRVWIDGLYTGTLATDQQRLEAAQGDWTKMFKLNESTGLIDVLKTISAATINSLTVVKEFIFGNRRMVGVANDESDGTLNEQRNDLIATPRSVQSHGDQRYLIKITDEDQTVKGNVDFKREVTSNSLDVHNDVRVGGRIDIPYSDENEETVAVQVGRFNNTAGQITGLQITKEGLLTASGIIAMSLEVFELIYNKIRAIGGKVALSSVANIEKCLYVLKVEGDNIPDEDKQRITPEEFYAENSRYTLSNIDYVSVTFKEDEYNEGLIPFAHGDIIYGYVNKIGESGQYARSGQCCMYIISTNEEISDANNGINGYQKMTVKAGLFIGEVTDENGNLLYDYENLVVGNMPPTVGMAVAHRGNVSADYPDRMSSFFIDSQFGNIVMLQNVSTPKIGYGNYGVILGRLPVDLFQKVQMKFQYLKEKDPVVYAKYGIFENLLQFDHQGNPILRENNRGEWNQVTAEGADINKYKNNESYYDTVTYDGQLWKCVENDTTDVPGKGTGWLLLVAKGSSITYELKASPSSISILSDGSLSSDVIDVSVISATGSDVKEMYHDELKQQNLKVQYSVNSGIERIDHPILPSGIIVTEDGEKILTTEDGSYLSFETKGIPVDSTYTSVSLYLVDVNSGIDRVRLDIPVLRNGKDGRNGEDGKSFEANNILLNSNFDYFDSDGMTLSHWGIVSGMRHMVVGHVYGSYNGVLFSDLSGSYMSQTITIGAQKTVLSFRCKQKYQYGCFVAVNCSELKNIIFEPIEEYDGAIHRQYNSEFGYGYSIGSTVNSYELCAFRLIILEQTEVTITFGSTQNGDFYITTPQLELGDKVTTYSKAAAELTGPKGDSGASIYPAGDWDANVEYRKELNCKPMVWYKPFDDVEGSYYVLKADISVGSKPTDKKDWEVFQYVKFQYAEFLMANWACFGNKYGGVFYDKYLFSQYGVKEDGEYSTYPQDMFDKDNDLSGSFIPSLYINFYDGELKTNKLSETYQEFTYGDLAKEIKQGESYNVKVAIGDGEGNTYTKLLCMPQSRDLSLSINGEELVLSPRQDWEPDGMRSSVLVKSLRNWERRMRATIEGWSSGYINKFETLAEAAKHCLLMCSDARYFNPLNFSLGTDGSIQNLAVRDNNDGLGIYEMGNFVIGGVFTDFILVEPGQNVIMRSCEENVSTTGLGSRTLWYIENAEDFMEVPLYIRYQINNCVDASTGGVVRLENPKYYAYGYETAESGYRVRTFMSKSLYALYSKLPDDNKELRIDVYSTENGIDLTSSYDWAKTVDYIECINLSLD